VGGAGVEIRERLSERHKRTSFEQRVECQRLAESYAQRNSDENTSSLSVAEVEYSPALNTCVGSFFGVVFNEQVFKVVDVVSQREIYYESCNEQRNCGEGNDIRLREQRDEAYKQALSGKTKE
jgi:hypothetical protein